MDPKFEQGYGEHMREQYSANHVSETTRTIIEGIPECMLDVISGLSRPWHILYSNHPCGMDVGGVTCTICAKD